ncbi:Fe2+/Zn2+ uptake regulation protein [Candidatus Scalindua japonica]|uniref:Fe2+/Zn2+ uptake regulation protein n=1 Tax=Candidatus Scalindua japonica TaxID=1284222 RepID=A0A286U3Z0_9BACT|nr:transcriptional repressor [Candidatus Scalindua japonica]GAX62847.1 Fe2+/Zn2+ uptake regulation protein [Candidatus Scalindua japonica]
MDTSENLIDKFRRKSYKITPQRLGIFKILEGNLHHPSAEDIFEKIKKTYPTISFTTVYKTLDILERMGEILKITIDDERKHYDPNTETHHHIICLECNKISDVDADSVSPQLPDEILEEFTPVRYHVSFYGTCKNCLSRQ